MESASEPVRSTVSVSINAVLSIPEFEGLKEVATAGRVLLSQLPSSFQADRVLMSYEQHLHQLDSRDADGPYIVGQLLESISTVLQSPDHIGSRYLGDHRWKLAIEAYVPRINRHVLVHIKAIWRSCVKDAPGPDELLFTTGWVGGADSLTGWIRSHELHRVSSAP